MEVNDYLVIAMFLTFVGLLFTGFPVAWVLGGVAVIFTAVGYFSDLWFGTWTGLDYLTLGMSVNRVYKFMDNWVLVALPMFIFMGLMLDRSGIAEKLMRSMQNLFGKVRGGLAVTVTTIGVILAASTGIIGASVVLLGLLSLPAFACPEEIAATRIQTEESALLLVSEAEQVPVQQDRGAHVH